MSYPNKTVALKLEYPVEHAGKTIETLAIRRPKVRDNMIAGKKEDDADKEITLMSMLAGVDDTVIHEMDMIDYSAFQKVIVDFRKKPTSESETSSEA